MIDDGHLTNQLIIDAVNDGNLDEAQLDLLVKDILRIVYKGQMGAKKGADQKTEEHHAFARKVASESMVLLKNDNQVLPLSKKKYKKIQEI